MGSVLASGMAPSTCLGSVAELLSGLALPLIAGAFGTFVLFLFLGLLALPFTAFMDRVIGKEKALLVYALGLLAFTFLVYGPTKVKGGKTQPGKADKIVVEPLDQAGDPFARPTFGLDASTPGDGERRNVFAAFSDTSDLPPPELEAPPWLAMETSLPPPVPGPAPGYRHTLRGAQPRLGTDDVGIAAIADEAFAEYEVTPQDVYDWIPLGNSRSYTYIVAIDAGEGWVREGQEGFDDLLWKWHRAEPSERGAYQLRFALVGNEKAAAKLLSDADLIRVRQQGTITTGRGDLHEVWNLRRTVHFLFREALQSAGLRHGTWAQSTDINGLRAVARKMAAIGQTGKEGGVGWQRAAALLERALVVADEAGDVNRRSEILLELLEAYQAMHEEQAIFRVLAQYTRSNPRRAEGWAWTGDLLLDRMGEPGAALEYYDRALDLKSNHVGAHLGRSRALAQLGRHDDALKSIDRAGSSPEAQVQRATCLLRVGRADRARSTIDAVLVRDPSNAKAVLVRGAVHYTLGDLDTARAAFQQAATMSGGHEVRAQAAYGLGLTCVRLGQKQAAEQAFEACERALSLGSSLGAIPDETVSPALGRAFLAWAGVRFDIAEPDPEDAAAVAEARATREASEAAKDQVITQLGRAREEAPRSSYLEMFAGMFASLDGDHNAAKRALDRAGYLSTGYAELDGWLGKTHLALGEIALTSGAEMDVVAEDLDRAVAYMARAADRERARDKDAVAMRVREALVRLGAQNEPRRIRYRAAKDAIQKVLTNDTHREHAPALCVRAYAQFQLGEYDETIRDFQAVLDAVPRESSHRWFEWRGYAEARRNDVKRWRDLEEKRVIFEGVRPNQDWEFSEAQGVTVSIEDGVLQFRTKARGATKDGRLKTPTIALTTPTLFTKRTFEELSLEIKIPGEQRGTILNNNVFGVQVKQATRSAKAAGIGIFNDKGRVAVRVGGGRDDRFEDGEVHRLLDTSGQEIAWPSDDWITLRIVREDDDQGIILIQLEGLDLIGDEGPPGVMRQKISGMRASNGKLELWIGGYANETEPFDVQVRNMRVIRRKKGR